jgi:dimethylargininase
MCDSLPFSYDLAIVMKDVPESLNDGLSLSKHEPINLDVAREQHEQYKRFLASRNIELIEIETDNSYPDCVFVEDTLVAVKNRLFLTYPGAISRQGELKIIENKLNEIKSKYKLDIVCMTNTNQATIDGGDVLYTGREFFVGLSTRTNLKGTYSIYMKFFLSLKFYFCFN